MKRIQILSLYVIISLVLTSCGGGSDTEKKNDSSNPLSAGSITHNGTSYDTVISPLTGKTWLDRNLGAARVCESFNDTACYGDYYQWGRGFDGHEDSRSGTTKTLATSINNVGRQFIITPNSDKDDWIEIADSDGSQRSKNWSKIDGSSICPAGFRVPTAVELKKELLVEGIAKQNKNSAFDSFLKVPFAGLHALSTGVILRDRSHAYLWTSTPDESKTLSVHMFNDGEAQYGYAYSQFRADGFSVRCIKD